MKMMYCYDKHSNLLCIIESSAVESMSWHEDGIYIYINQKWRDYDEIYSDRAYTIKCDWTKSAHLSAVNGKFLREKGIRVLFYDETVHHDMPDNELIGF